MSTNSPKKSLYILFSVIVIDLIGFGIVMPILPFYAAQFGASATVMGLLLTSFAAMQFLFSPLWGKASDRWGRKKVLVFTMIGSAFSLFLQGSVDTLPLLFVGRILSGIFAANISVASAYVTDVTDEADRAKGMGMIGAAFGIGFLIGPALGGILSKHSYHLPLLVASGLTFLNTIYTALRLPEPERHSSPKEKLKLTLLQRKEVLSLCLLYFVFTVGVSQLESVFAFYMKDKFNYDAPHVAGILAMMALIMVGVQGGLVRKLTPIWGEEKMLRYGAVLLIGSFAAIPWMPYVSLLLIPLAIASLGRGISQPSLLSLVSKKSTTHTRGSVMGLFQASASLGRVVGPLAAGVLYDHSPVYPFMIASFLILAMLTLIGFE